MAWERKDLISIGALCVSIMALAVSWNSGRYNIRQAELSERRETFERSLREPIFEASLDPTKDADIFELRIDITNRHSARIAFDSITLEGDGVEFVRIVQSGEPISSGQSAPADLTKRIDANSSDSRLGYARIKNRTETAPTVILRFKFYFTDREAIGHERWRRLHPL